MTRRLVWIQKQAAALDRRRQETAEAAIADAKIQNQRMSR